jgi:hypothetical protein
MDMPSRNVFKAILLSGALCSASWVQAQSPEASVPLDESQLTATVTALDSALFGAYNRCDLTTFASYIAPDVEFYHDKGGVTLGRDKLVDSVRHNICGKLRRGLIAGTLEVDAIKGYGAVETGSHRFCEIGTGHCAVARFVHLWHYHNGVWQLSRVISYDHGAPAK